MENKEIWKPVKGYEGYYEVSNLGNVRSVDRVVVYSNGAKHSYKGTILSTRPNSAGYTTVRLSINQDRVNHFVHRLVAEAFLPNPNNYPQVNHKDENPKNNALENLEWCSATYNINYGNRNKSTRRPIVRLSLEGDYIDSYDGIRQAARELGLSNSGISGALTGTYYTHLGYCWVYKEEYERYFR